MEDGDLKCIWSYSSDFKMELQSGSQCDFQLRLIHDESWRIILMLLNHSTDSPSLFIFIFSSFQSSSFLSSLFLFGLIVDYSSELGEDC